MGRDSSKDPVRKLLIAQPKFVRELIAGGVAGGLAKTCVAPLERGKIMIQTGRLPGLGVTGILSHVWQTEGIAGMFRGNGASVLRIVPYAAIHFSAYENYRRLLVEHVMEPNGTTGSKATVHPLWDLLAGSAAGATAVLLTYPLDLVRTRMAYIMEAAPGKVGTGPTSAAGPGAMAHAAGGGGLGGLTAAAAPPAQHVAHPGIRQMLVQIAREDGGLVGLYRGVNPTLLGILPYAGLKFYVYQSLKAWYKAPERQQLGATAPASSTDGQQRTLDVDVHKRLTSDRDAAAAATDCVLLAGTAAAAEEGLDIDTIEAAAGGTHGGTGGGTGGGTASGVSGGGEGSGGSKGGGGHSRLPLPVMLGFGGVAGLIAQTVTYPLDVIRRRMQVGDQGSVRATTWSTTRAILTQEGWWGLMRGLSINYLKVVPSTAIGFTVYDQLKEYMDIRGNL